MSNLETLMAAGVIPQDNTLSEEDRSVVEALTYLEIQALIALKQKLGEDFLRRNCGANIANCFL